MTGIALLKKTQEAFVSNENLSVSETISYIPKKTLNPISTKAFPGGGSFAKKEKDNIENMISFASVKLDTPPKPGDTISYESTMWYVKRHTINNGLYTIYCEKSQHNTRPRSRKP